MSIRILIADDQRLFRQSLKYLLEQERDIEVVGEAADGQDAYTLSQETRPDIVLMDVDMPKLDGINATRMILEREPHIRVLMLSVHDEDERIINAIRSGAVGYILKDADHKEFIRIIRSTFSGKDVISPFLAHLHPRVLSQIEGRPPADKDKQAETHAEAEAIAAAKAKVAYQISLLTDRESEILNLLADGKSNKEIADRMFVSVETVKSHLQTIYKKLGVRSRTEAAIYLLKVQDFH